MKQIIRFEANDGSIFTDREECLNYESLCLNLDNAMRFLKPRVPLDDDKYTQHGMGTVRSVRNKVVRIIGDYMDINEHHIEGAIKSEHNQTMFTRIVSDSGNKKANSVLYRLMCMSLDTDREYSQPYFLRKEEGR